MNKESAALISVLSKCNPQDKELEQESRVQEIVYSREYAELQHREAFADVFEENFSKAKLRQYSAAQLSKISETIPILPEFLDNLLFSLKNGPAPTLTPDDKPNFFDKSKIEALSKRLEEGTGKNYTNIDAEDFMAIFDDNTVRSIGDRFEELPYESADCARDIAALLGASKYCISASEVEQLQSEYDEKVGALQSALAMSQKSKNRHRYFKLFVGLGFLFIPAFFAAATGALSTSALGVCIVIQLILVIIYWIWG